MAARLTRMPARAVEDSLKRALTAAGYTLATDSERVRLLADRDGNARRATAEGSGIGAVLSSILLVARRRARFGAEVVGDSTARATRDATATCRKTML